MRFATVLLVVLVSCGDDDGTINPDAGTDVGPDAPAMDTGADAPMVDAATDAPTVDGGSDSGVDAGADTGPVDAGGMPMVADITDPLMDPRQGHVFGIVGDGRAIVAGGTGGTRTLFETWALDLSDSTWTLLEELPTAHYAASSLVLPDGRMLVSGGAPSVFATTSKDTIYIFDPDTDSWSAAGTMTGPRDAHAMILVERGPDTGKVLIVGGEQRGPSGATYLDSIELYDPTTMMSTLLEDTVLPSVRVSFFHYTLSDGRIVIANGYTDPGDPGDSAVDEILIYDPMDHSIDVQTETLPEAELFDFLGILPSGDALLFPSRFASTTIRTMDPDTFETTDIGTLPTEVTFYGLARIPSGTAFLFGGDEGGTRTADVRAFDPTTGDWTTYDDLLPMALGGIWPSALPDDRVLLLGGQTEIGFLVGNTLLFTP